MTRGGATRARRPARSRRRVAVRLVALVLGAGLLGAVGPAAAGDFFAKHPRHSGPGARAPFSGGGPFKVPPPKPHHATGRHDHQRGHGRHHGHHGHTGAVVYPVGVVGYGFAPYGSAYAPPAYAYPPEIAIAPVFVNAPAVYYAAPAAAVEPVAAEPRRPSVIEYDTGRHELRGDGVTTPYVWVWVPNPPPPPATAAAPAPRGADPAAGAPAPRSRLYRWTDAQGTVHLTNDRDAVPDEHRAPAPRAPR